MRRRDDGRGAPIETTNEKAVRIYLNVIIWIINAGRFAVHYEDPLRRNYKIASTLVYKDAYARNPPFVNGLT